MASPPCSIEVDANYCCFPPSSEQERPATLLVPPKVFVVLHFSKKVSTLTTECVEEYKGEGHHSFRRPQEAIDRVPAMLRDALPGFSDKLDLAAQSTKLQTFISDAAERESGRESLTFDIDVRAKQEIPDEDYKRETSRKRRGDEEGTCCCAVCLDELYPKKRKPGRPREVISLEDCNHGFHVTCINQWLQYHMTCPVCRSFVG